METINLLGEAFNPTPETLEMCVSIFNRFLEENSTFNSKFVAITTFWMGSKFYEVYPISLETMEKITKMNRDYFKSLELLILKTINFELL